MTMVNDFETRMRNLHATALKIDQIERMLHEATIAHAKAIQDLELAMRAHWTLELDSSPEVRAKVHALWVDYDVSL